ncbi:CLIP-associating protein 1 isoform X24 [Histomonas meleagridis]|uniref:CLIP-associating protein 1 isoform X24 n=1 Tax=Histomonas meleagridis TaxID=135588 RepID=UPI00355A0551|nr:CLIP-associating protein 1 isoform X24 [Histomonas meleagridis]KAH0798746.1 CLIP-associating protein 1 isoform X24 [Histomonas meleagridis]
MGIKRSSSVSRAYPTTAELSTQTRKLFQNAGVDVKPIRFRSPHEAANEINFLETNIAKGVEWDRQVSAIQHGMAVVNGNALEFDVFQKGLSKIYIGLVACATNLRSALVKQSCLFISQLAREMGSSFDTIGDFISPLSTQLSHGTQIISESTKFTILCIAKYCPSRRIFKSLLDLSNSRSSTATAVAAEALLLVMQNWDSQILLPQISKFEAAISKLLNSPSLNTRSFARQATKAYKIAYPNKSAYFISKLDPRTQRTINDCQLQEVSRIPNKEEQRTSVSQIQRKPTHQVIPSNPESSSDIASNPPRMIKYKRQEIEANEIQRQQVENDRRPPPSSRRRGQIHPSNRQHPNQAEKEPEEKKRNRYVRSYVTTEENDDNFISRITAPKRQSSVQPQRRSNDSLSFRSTIESSLRRIQQNAEKRKPLHLVCGEEKNYLELLKQYINEDKKTELASSMAYISRDLLTCITNVLPTISSTALEILKEFLPIYAPHFRPVLTTLVETLINQIELGNPRSSETAQTILSDLYKVFDSNTLLLICVALQPSIPLLNFTESLISLNNINLSNDSICQKLLLLSFKCYNIGNIKNRHTAAKIVESVNEANSKSVYNFTETLNDQQLKQFEEFISPYIPSLHLRQISAEVPIFNINSPIAWLKKVENLISNINNDNEWIQIRPKLYTELNQALCNKIEVDGILSIIHTTILSKGVDDYDKLFSGLLLNARGNSSMIIDAIFNIIVKQSSAVELFATLQKHICEFDKNTDISRAAISFQNKLIQNINKDLLIQIVPTLIPALTKAFEAKPSEIRKAVVLSFVELYAKLGDEIMDKHTAHLNKGQQKLIAIYLSRRT